MNVLDYTIYSIKDIFSKVDEYYINEKLLNWAIRKFKSLKCRKWRACHWLKELYRQYPTLFTHWRVWNWGGSLQLTRPAMESWNHSFKVEVIHGERFSTRSEAKHQVFE